MSGAYSIRGLSASGWVTGTGALAPTLPTGWAVGDLHLLITSVHSGSETLATPSGWTLLSPGTEVNQSKIFGRIAQSGDTAPSVDWSGTSSGQAIVLGLFGDVYTDLATIVHASTDRATTNSATPLQVPLRALTVTLDNCYLIAFGKLFKTATSDGATFSTAPTFFTKRTELVRNGSQDACAIWDVQQTIAVSLSAGVAGYSASDTTPAAVYSIILALKTNPVAEVQIDTVGTVTDGASFTIAGTGFSATGNSVTLGGVTQTVTAQSTTSITCTAALGSMQYGVPYSLVVTNSSGISNAVSDPTSTVVNPSASVEYVTLLAPLVPSDQRLTATPDLQAGWQVEVSNVTGGKTLTDVQLYSDGEWIATAGSYSFDVRVNDGVNGWSAAATQTVAVALPTITVDISNVTVVQGSTATFSLSATGSITGYQWYKNGSVISGATSSSYTTPTTVSGDNGATFFCRVSNVSGYTQSSTAVLTVALSALPLRNDVWDGSLPGLTINRGRAYLWNTAIQTSPSGKESRVKLMQYPRVRFTLQYELLRNNLAVSELKSIMGLFNAAAGSYDTFLYRDPDFNRVTLEKFGTGDGTTTAFQLIASFQNNGGVGAPELIQNLNGVPSIYQNGALVSTSAYTISPLGVVTFTSARPANADLRWSGDFYYRVRFTEDTLEMTQFMDQWWQSKSIALTSIKL